MVERLPNDMAARTACERPRHSPNPADEQHAARLRRGIQRAEMPAEVGRDAAAEVEEAAVGVVAGEVAELVGDEEMVGAGADVGRTEESLAEVFELHGGGAGSAEVVVEGESG